jgi:hypothetical protein
VFVEPIIMNRGGMLWVFNVSANFLVAILRVNGFRRGFGISYISLVLGSVSEVKP